MFDVKQFVTDVGEAQKGDYSIAFKLLGLIVFITEEGSDPILSGRFISARTYHRWMDLINSVGWGNLVADARLRKELQEYM